MTQRKGLHRVASAVSAPVYTAREAMIDSQLKPCGVVSSRAVSAFFSVAREDYVAPSRRRLAYVDAAQPLGNGREMMAPLSLGYLVEDAAATPTDTVLVVGATTGYAAAVLSHMAGRVVALESDADLAAKALANLGSYPNVEVVEGPLEAGWAAGAPYSIILIDGAVEVLPPELIAQLAEGGRLFAILHGTDRVSRAARGRKQAGTLHLEPFAESAGTVLPPFRRAPAFRF